MARWWEGFWCLFLAETAETAAEFKNKSQNRPYIYKSEKENLLCGLNSHQC